jgi:hypothetical protein
MNATVRMASERRLACGRCGAAFVCGNGGRDGQCWCADEPKLLPLPANSSEDCLCPACLHVALREAAR